MNSHQQQFLISCAFCSENFQDTILKFCDHVKAKHLNLKNEFNFEGLLCHDGKIYMAFNNFLIEVRQPSTKILKIVNNNKVNISRNSSQVDKCLEEHSLKFQKFPTEPR